MKKFVATSVDINLFERSKASRVALTEFAVLLVYNQRSNFSQSCDRRTIFRQQFQKAIKFLPRP